MSQADGSIIIDTRIDEAGFSKGLNTMKTAAVAGVAAITAAIGTASVAVINLGSEFEQANAKASTLFGDAQVDMTQYQGKMLELSTKTGLAASELGNTMYDALSSGITVMICRKRWDSWRRIRNWQAGLRCQYSHYSNSQGAECV